MLNGLQSGTGRLTEEETVVCPVIKITLCIIHTNNRPSEPNGYYIYIYINHQV